MGNYPPNNYPPVNGLDYKEGSRVRSTAVKVTLLLALLRTCLLGSVIIQVLNSDNRGKEWTSDNSGHGIGACWPAHPPLPATVLSSRG